MKPTLIIKILSFSLVFLSINLTAQIDKDNNEYKKEFESFKNKIQKEFDYFKSKNDSIFLHFLKTSWGSFNLIYNYKHKAPKPSKQPIIKQTKQIELKITPIKQKGNIKFIKGKKSIEQTKIINKLKDFKTNAKVRSKIDFYGNKLELYYDTNLPQIRYIKSESITDYFRKASSNNNLIKTVLLLKLSADKYKLNDWGFLKTLQSASSKLYSDINNMTLFTWFALLQNGYNVKIAYNNQNVYLLIPSDQEIFNTSYFSLDNCKYYIVKFSDNNIKPNSLFAHKANYPGNSNSFSLLIDETPDFKYDIIEKELSYRNIKLIISLNLNLIKFYKDYPDCELSVYFSTKLSKNCLKGFDSLFIKKLKDKSELSKINYLLDFLQHSIPYINDEDQFGKENYLFAEEAIYYSGADCEDRSALLAQLIDRYIGIQTIGLSFPEHISLAANLSEPIKGVYLPFQGNNYYISDPTYIGAKCGMLMPDLRTEYPEIIEWIKKK